MKKTKRIAVILIVSSLGLNGCCIFKEGSWAPLPSCQNAEKYAKEKEKEKKTTDENSSTIDETKEGKN